MAVRFQKSFKILPGLRLNLSKSGIGISAGMKGFHVGVDGHGRKYVNAGVPGTGLSARKYLGATPATPALISPPGRASLLPIVGAIAILLLILAAWLIWSIRSNSPSRPPMPASSSAAVPTSQTPATRSAPVSVAARHQEWRVL